MNEFKSINCHMWVSESFNTNKIINLQKKDGEYIINDDIWFGVSAATSTLDEKITEGISFPIRDTLHERI